MCSYGDEVSTIWSQTLPRARKQHVCEECRLKIKPGTTYARTASLYDGSWTNYAVHLECQTLAAELGDLMCGDEGAAIGQMREHLAEAGIAFCDPPDVDEAEEEVFQWVPVPLPTLRDVSNVRRAWAEIQRKYA